MTREILKPFTRKHYDAYKSWFNDKSLRLNLSGIDEEWLNFVLTDKMGEEWVIEIEGKLVSVVGIVLPTIESPEYVVTNIAVNPNYKRQGFGKKALSKVLQYYRQFPIKCWKAYVDIKNEDAQHFFVNYGWEKLGLEKDEKMISFRYENVAIKP